MAEGNPPPALVEPASEAESQVQLDIADEDDAPIQISSAVNKKAKLNNFLSLFGFNDVDDRKYNNRAMSDDVRGDVGGPAGKKPRKRKSQFQTVVYGDVDSDDDDDYAHDIPDHDSDAVADSDDTKEGEGEEALDEDGEEQDEDEGEDEEMWEDEPVEFLDDDAIEELEAEAEYAAELERERVRELRLLEIKRIKETLIERYLKTARIMITLRKKNIYLQDYLYHLALRKGVLRGDPSAHGQHARGDDGDDDSVTGSQYNFAKLQKHRLQKKNALMAARFARFLRKTGHLLDDEQADMPVHAKHQKHRGSIKKRGGNNRLKSRGHNIDQRNQKNGRSIEKNAGNQSKGTRNRKRLSPNEMAQQNALMTMNKSMKTTDEVLEALEHHRCKMKKQKQLVKRAHLLQQQKAKEVPVLDQERAHLVHFVEHSVTAQNLLKRKALRRQKKNLSISAKKTGMTNVNHQWTKSLERIRELRMKKAKLEQDHRLLLIKKVHQWDTWEQRDLSALESVADFILAMASRTTLSRKETEGFNAGMEQFRKQLYTLFEAMLHQIARLYKAKSMLHMAQRKLKDKASVATESVKGFSLGDFERMAIENREAHQKVSERKLHLVEQSHKLQKYIQKVARGHHDKKIIWGALHAGRHDLKQLWQLCHIERDSLLKKWKDALRVKRVHRRMFMQVAVVENQRVFTDYLRVQNRVHELQEKRRLLNTRYRQGSALLRVLNIKTNEVRKTITETREGRKEKAFGDEQTFFKNTIQYRLNPRIPNTVHSVNTKRNSSLHRILEPEINPVIFRPIGYAPKRK